MPALLSNVKAFLPARLRLACVLSAFGLGVLLWVSPAAAEGRFEVINAGARQESAGWLVDARIDLQLGEEGLKALQSGVTLRIAFQYEVTRKRRFWPDEIIESHQQEFEVQYLSLSQRYVVRNIDESEINSYATLFSALRYLGQVRDHLLIESLPDDDPRRFEFAVRAVLDWEKLPGPLAVLTFWRGDFSLESDWYRWTPKE